MSLMYLIPWLASASAAEVVWLDGRPSAEDLAALTAVVGGGLTIRDPLDLRAAATSIREEDRAAWRGLEVALREARPFETRLDGELVIMEELDQALDRITVVPDIEARDRLFGALAYQGFAVDRFFMDRLGDDDRAEAYRAALPSGEVVPRPWLDAVALDPARAITPYEIAEAVQRSHFQEVKDAADQLLPARVTVEGELPAGSQLVVDGQAQNLGSTGRARIRAGVHYVHVAIDDHVVGRWRKRVGPNETLAVRVSLDDATWDGWLSALRSQGSDVPTPEALAPALDAWGGEAWVGWSEGGAPRVVRVTADGAEAVPMRARVRSTMSPTGSSDDGLLVQVAAGVGGGWMSSGDFYLQDPVNVPRTAASVNAGALAIVADVSLQYGLFRASILADFGVPLGEYHTARFGDRSMRVRPDLSLGVGVKYAQLTGGFMFPHHPTVGARATIPVFRGLEVLGTFRAGVPMSMVRSDGSTWTSLPVWQGWVGVGYRFGVNVGG